MEDFLIILLGLAWILYSFYSRGKKRKKASARKANEAPREKRDPSPEKIIQELFGIPSGEPVFEPPLDDSYEPEPSFKPKPEETARKMKPFLDSEIEQYLGGRFAGESHFTRVSPVGSFMPESPESVDFDLHRAVILSEILRAPYIHSDGHFF
ncbi:MAG: hypothetical protein JW861_07225 [Bacteroidales bacterium]|nr:hypothetical protein [Bacteroidales bacterium]